MRKKPPAWKVRNAFPLAIAWLYFSLSLSCAPPPFEAYVSGALADRPSEKPYAAQTEVSISRSAWYMNGSITYPGTRAEGLLLNVRMVHATFEDRNSATCPREFDADANTEAFIAKLPEYVAHGVRAFTISLQGSHPGYKGSVCSAYEPDGSLRPEYMRRVAKVIEACDRLGAAVILCCFTGEQDQVLKDAEAVKNGVRQAASWVRERGYKNVCFEIADGHPSKDYQHEIIRDPSGVSELIRLAHATAPGLLVASSGAGGGRTAHQIAVEGDFVLLHFTNVPIDEILERVASADKVSKPIVCNRDERTGEEGARALETTVNAWCSWGYANVKKNERFPFRFEGSADDPVVYAKFKELSSS